MRFDSANHRPAAQPEAPTSESKFSQIAKTAMRPISAARSAISGYRNAREDTAAIKSTVNMIHAGMAAHKAKQDQKVEAPAPAQKGSSVWNTKPQPIVANDQSAKPQSTVSATQAARDLAWAAISNVSAQPQRHEAQQAQQTMRL